MKVYDVRTEVLSETGEVVESGHLVGLSFSSSSAGATVEITVGGAPVLSLKVPANETRLWSLPSGHYLYLPAGSVVDITGNNAMVMLYFR